MPSWSERRRGPTREQPTPGEGSRIAGGVANGLAAWPDLRRLGALLIGGAATAVWPARWDPILVESWFRLYRVVGGKTLDRIVSRMERHLPAAPGGETHRALAEHHVRSRIEDMLGRVRGLRRSGYRPAIEIVGVEHLRSALSRGRGAVVWGMRVGSATVMKQGFRDAGFPLVHLSRADHGSLTQTRVGLGVVAPLYRRGEDVLLRERVQIPLSDSLAYLRTVGERLAANQCVSIFGEHPGRQTIEVAVLGLSRRFALGAPSLAWRGNAGLLTAYVLRLGSFRHRLVIEEEIPVDTALPRRRFAERAVHEFAARLERSIRRHPGDWQAWFYPEIVGDSEAEQRTARRG